MDKSKLSINLKKNLNLQMGLRALLIYTICLIITIAQARIANYGNLNDAYENHRAR